jgi:hypothetical protein
MLLSTSKWILPKTGLQQLWWSSRVREKIAGGVRERVWY